MLLCEIRCWNWIYYFLFEYIAWHLYTWSDVRNGIKILRKGFANVGRCDGMRQSQIRLNWLKLNHGCVLCINFLYFVITEMLWIYRISVYLRWKIFLHDSNTAQIYGDILRKLHQCRCFVSSHRHFCTRLGIDAIFFILFFWTFAKCKL